VEVQVFVRLPLALLSKTSGRETMRYTIGSVAQLLIMHVHPSATVKEVTKPNSPSVRVR
jgi:hypothetical protein